MSEPMTAERLVEIKHTLYLWTELDEDDALELIAEVERLQAEVEQLDQQLADTTMEAIERGNQVDRYRAALEEARHELTTLNGLAATDRLGIYSEALSEGCDPSGAWDCLMDVMFTIDTNKTLAKVDEALGGANG